jgi:hypothetical protein
VVGADNTALFGHIIAGHPESYVSYMILARDISTQIEEIFGEGMLLAAESSGTVQDLDLEQVGPNANLPTRPTPERRKLDILVIRDVAINFVTTISLLGGKTSPPLASARSELQTLQILYTGLIGDLIPEDREPESIINNQKKDLNSCLFLTSEPGVENIWEDTKVISRVENFMWISHQEQKLQAITEIGQCLDRIQEIVKVAKNEAKHVRVTSEPLYPLFSEQSVD